MRDWSTDTLLTGHALATFLLTENLSDLHPLLVNNSAGRPRQGAAPDAGGAGARALQMTASDYPTALKDYGGRLRRIAAAACRRELRVPSRGC